MPPANVVARSERLDLRAAAPRLRALMVGLVLFGFGIALMVEGRAGSGPWEALNQGVARQTDQEIGTISILLGIPTDLGPRPRDGLMTGAARRFGWSIRRARTAIELTVLAIGWALGGSVGLGTVVSRSGSGPCCSWRCASSIETGGSVECVASNSK